MSAPPVATDSDGRAGGELCVSMRRLVAADVTRMSAEEYDAHLGELMVYTNRLVVWERDRSAALDARQSELNKRDQAQAELAQDLKKHTADLRVWCAESEGKFASHKEVLANIVHPTGASGATYAQANFVGHSSSLLPRRDLRKRPRREDSIGEREGARQVPLSLTADEGPSAALWDVGTETNGPDHAQDSSSATRTISRKRGKRYQQAPPPLPIEEVVTLLSACDGPGRRFPASTLSDEVLTAMRPYLVRYQDPKINADLRMPVRGGARKCGTSRALGFAGLQRLAVDHACEACVEHKRLCIHVTSDQPPCIMPRPLEQRQGLTMADPAFWTTSE